MSHKQEVEEPYTACEPWFGHRWPIGSDLTEVINFFRTKKNFCKILIQMLYFTQILSRC